MAAELIGYIYSIDRRVSYVMKNGETLILNPGSHITSHTDAEIIAAPVPINITYTTGDTELKCMYVPKSYLDKQTHVPASIFLKEAHAVRELVTNTKTELASIKSELASLRDSVSQAAARVPGRVFVGSVVTTVESSISPSEHEAILFSQEGFKAKFGRYFDWEKDFVGVMNTTGYASGPYVDSAALVTKGNISVGVPGVSNGSRITLNYLVVLGD